MSEHDLVDQSLLTAWGSVLNKPDPLVGRIFIAGWSTYTVLSEEEDLCYILNSSGRVIPLTTTAVKTWLEQAEILR